MRMSDMIEEFIKELFEDEEPFLCSILLSFE